MRTDLQSILKVMKGQLKRYEIQYILYTSTPPTTFWFWYFHYSNIDKISYSIPGLNIQIFGFYDNSRCCLLSLNVIAKFENWVFHCCWHFLIWFWQFPIMKVHKLSRTKCLPSNVMPTSTSHILSSSVKYCMMLNTIACQPSQTNIYC